MGSHARRLAKLDDLRDGPTSTPSFYTGFDILPPRLPFGQCKRSEIGPPDERR